MQGTPGQTNDLSLIIALFSKDRERKLKTMMAQQFEQMDGLPDVMSGPDGSTIIHLRNDKALDVLEKQLKDAASKKIESSTELAFDDMEVKMMERFRFKRIGKSGWMPGIYGSSWAFTPSSLKLVIIEYSHDSFSPFNSPFPRHAPSFDKRSHDL